MPAAVLLDSPSQHAMSPDTMSASQAEYDGLGKEDSYTDNEKAPAYDFSSSAEVVDRKRQSPYLSRMRSTTTLVRHARRSGLWKAPVIMFMTLLSAAIVGIAHHVFLTVLDEKSVADFPYPQTWIRDVGNALSRVVQILLELSVGIALTQSIWFYVKRFNVSLSEVDDLFSLPSITSFPPILLKWSALLVLPFAIMIQAFALVGILAPNALSVIPARPTKVTLKVPFPGLDKIPVVDSSVFWDYSKGFLYSSPSPAFSRVANGVLNNGAFLPWTAPSGCGLACNYTLIYHGPSLQCQDLPDHSIAVMPTVDAWDGDRRLPHPAFINGSIPVVNPIAFIEQDVLYNGTSSIGVPKLGTLDNSTLPTGPYFDRTWAPEGPYAFQLIYATNNFSIDAGKQDYYRTSGSYCIFRNATYHTSVSFANGSQTVVPRISEYGDPLLWLQESDESNPWGWIQTLSSDSAAQFSFATLALVDAISRYFTGQVSIVGRGPAQITALHTRILDSAVFTFTASNNPNTFSIAPSSAMTNGVSRALEDLCSHVIASLMSDEASLGIHAPVTATVLPDMNIYDYRPSRLWLVYGVAVAVAAVANILGLACMHWNGVAMQRTFSSVAASVRARELDDLLSGPEEAPRPMAKVAKLRYRAGLHREDGRSGFCIISGGDAVQMAEVVRLNANEGMSP
ncbi:unnamed protein product [Peniophora sp. CBMAI 1063]|nr:unnamed protein product [Peniophora sp. CBMAI 1063]